MVLLQAFGGVFSLLLVVGVGYVLAALGWFSPESRRLLPRLVTNVALPPFLLCTILRSFGREDLAHMPVFESITREDVAAFLGENIVEERAVLSEIVPK